jgi:hypothetical protein
MRQITQKTRASVKTNCTGGERRRAFHFFGWQFLAPDLNLNLNCFDARGFNQSQFRLPDAQRRLGAGLRAKTTSVLSRFMAALAHINKCKDSSCYGLEFLFSLDIALRDPNWPDGQRVGLSGAMPCRHGRSLLAAQTNAMK